MREREREGKEGEPREERRDKEGREKIEGEYRKGVGKRPVGGGGREEGWGLFGRRENG